MEPRDNVHVVERYRSLTWDQANEWLQAHNYVTDGKTDWAKVMREAEVGGTQYVLKQRWNEGGSRFQRQQIIERLEELEKKKPTAVGSRLAMLDEWNQIGEALIEEPDVLRKEMDRLRSDAEKMRKLGDARRALAKAEQNAFGSAVPGPKKPRR